MSRGSGSFIAALAGLGALFWAFAFGLSLGALDTHKERYDTYRYATDQPAEINPAAPREADAQPLEYRRPCKEPKGREESDLCAQWRAANAAEDSAFWAKWGFWITAFGAAGLLITIVQGRLALERAAEANAISGRVAAAELRPYLFVEDINLKDVRDETEEVEVDGETQVHRSFFSARAEVHLRNYGKVPARNIQVFRRSYQARFYQGRIYGLRKSTIPLAVCAPGHERRVFDRFYISAPDRPDFDIGLLIYVIRLRYTYEDEAGAKYTEKADHYLSGNDLNTFYLLLGPHQIARARRRWEDYEPDFWDDDSFVSDATDTANSDEGTSGED